MALRIEERRRGFPRPITCRRFQSWKVHQPHCAVRIPSSADGQRGASAPEVDHDAAALNFRPPPARSSRGGEPGKGGGWPRERAPPLRVNRREKKGITAGCNMLASAGKLTGTVEMG